MDITVKKKGKEKVEFVIEGVTPAFVNALRRIMIAEVPTLAIDWLEIHQNTSPLFDEMVSQRLGLLPLEFDLSKFRFQEDCKCEGKGCPLCQVVFALEKKGPCIVHSGDLKSSNKEVKPTSPDFPIVELLEGHAIKLESVARLGRGKEHAKFQAANAAYSNYPELKGEEINRDPQKFLFRVETVSGLTPQDIVLTAGEILEEKSLEFKKEAAKL